MARVLIIDDDDLFCDMIRQEVRFLGHDCVAALNLHEGTERSLSEAFDVVFLDVNLPDGNGLDMIPALRRMPSRPEVIIITGEGSADGAELAIKNGAWDYIVKPASLSTIVLPLIRALEYRGAQKGKKQPTLDLEGIMGRSAVMKGCFDLIAQAAWVDAGVLITGETGTGKELFARAIHRNSSRADKPFIVVDCASLKESLAESILFGHERGAYTGADRSREGLIRQANGGTLFLDEVGELPLSMQKKFLRVLQEHRFRPLGSSKDAGSDFRLIAATNRDLERMVREGEFRNDLLFRLRSISIEIPPLREHPEDIGEIVLYHIARICKSSGIGPKGFSPEFLEALSLYDWPGNIRELVHSLERAIASSRGEPMLFRQHLPGSIRVKLARRSIGGSETVPASEPLAERKAFPKLKEVRESTYAEVEKKYLRELLDETEGDMSRAVELSGVQRARLYDLLKKHQISFRR